TAFSFAAVQVWAPTRFAFAVALWNRYRDWKEERAKRKAQKDLDRRRAARPVVTAQMVPAKPAAPPVAQEPRRTGIERMTAEEELETVKDTPVSVAESPAPAPEVNERADSGAKPKTTLPRIAGGYKLPPSSLLHRP